ncbi:MAG: hypothetical protein HQL67_08195 [Magnetococcales bacterium]|nr:hypothetical protein [Magnetococcales bacterium]
MIEATPNAKDCPVDLPARDLKKMIRLVETLYQLHKQPEYVALVTPHLPESAQHDPGHDSVMMGYDFHLTPQGPQLIEVNTNAGGALLAWQSHRDQAPKLNQRPVQLLLSTFTQEMEKYSRGTLNKPKRIVVLDSEPEKQYLYPEMLEYARLFQAWGVDAQVVAPEALQSGADGVFLAGKAVDLIYNRHCDFYLETEAMAGLRAAYLAGRVCLTPNPRSYGLLADKRRLLIWSHEETLKKLGLPLKTIKTLLETIPTCQLLSQRNPSEVWQERRRWVIKPVDSFGSRGVTLGKSISRTRFASLTAEKTLLQELVLPSLTPTPWADKPMKTDLRLFVYGQKVLGVSSRIYQGQVTSFKEPGSGYAPVRIIR